VPRDNTDTLPPLAGFALIWIENPGVRITGPKSPPNIRRFANRAAAEAEKRQLKQSFPGCAISLVSGDHPAVWRCRRRS
jgi:hypothetical protein